MGTISAAKRDRYQITCQDCGGGYAPNKYAVYCNDCWDAKPFSSSRGLDLRAGDVITITKNLDGSTASMVFERDGKEFNPVKTA